jgi:uncharacterized protein (TIGR03067 family)
MWPRLFKCLVLAVAWSRVHAAASCDDGAVNDELKRHQGTWAVTSSIHDGQEAPADVARSIKRAVSDNHVVWERNGKRFAGTTVVLKPDQDPKAIDVIPDGGPNRGEHVLGIYKLDGDTLTICMAAPGQPRPKDWTAGKGSGRTLRVFKRERPTHKR